RSTGITVLDVDVTVRTHATMMVAADKRRARTAERYPLSVTGSTHVRCRGLQTLTTTPRKIVPNNDPRDAPDMNMFRLQQSARAMIAGILIVVVCGAGVAPAGAVTAPGAKLWVARYNGPANYGSDSPHSVAVSHDGTKVVVTGSSFGSG